MQTQYAQQAAQASWASSRHIKQDIAALLDVAHKVSEGPGKRLFAAYLAADRGEDYERLRDRDFGQLLRQAQQSPRLGPLVMAVEASLRHAPAHLAYRVAGDQVVFEARSGSGGQARRVGVLHLLDEVLAAQEVVLALTVALSCAALRDGRVVYDDVTFLEEAAGLDEAGIVGLYLRLVGMSQAHAEIEETRLLIAVEAGDTVPLLRSLLSVLAYVPDRITELGLTAARPAGDVTLVGPLRPWRGWQAVSDKDGLDGEAAFVEALASWTCDGQPLASRAQLRQWVAVRALGRAGEGYPGYVRPLRRLRLLAQRVGDQELQRVLEGLIRQLREGPAETASAEDVTRALVLWGAAEIPSMSAP